MRRGWKTSHGTPPTQTARLTLSANCSRTIPACSTCSATCGNGAATTHSANTQQTTSLILCIWLAIRRRPGSSVVGAGPTPRGSCGRRTGLATPLGTVATTWAFAAPVQGSEPGPEVGTRREEPERSGRSRRGAGGDSAAKSDDRLDPFFSTTAHFARIFSTVVLSDFEIRTPDLRLRRVRHGWQYQPFRPPSARQYSMACRQPFATMFHGFAIHQTPENASSMRRRSERFCDKSAGVIKLTAIKVLFLATSAITRIRLIWHIWRQIFQCRI